MANNIKKIGFTSQFQRLFAGPLDSTMLFDSWADMNSYLSDPTKYKGQLAVNKDNLKIYVLDYSSINDRWEWKAASGSGEGSGGTGDDRINLDTISYILKSLEYYTDHNEEDLFSLAWENMENVNIDAIESNSSQNGIHLGIEQYPGGLNNGIIIPIGTTKIGDFAFYDLNGLAKPLIFPDTLKEIGESAFWNLAQYPYPLVIPKNVNLVKEKAFNQCDAVPYIIMEGNTPPVIFKNSFPDDDNILIYVPEDNLIIYKTEWEGIDNFNIDRVISINRLLFDRIKERSEDSNKFLSGDGTYRVPTLHEEVNIDYLPYMQYAAGIYYENGDSEVFKDAWNNMLEINIEEIEESSFLDKTYYPNSNIEGIIIPKGITVIEENSFSNMTTFNKPFVIPEGVKEIKEDAFYNWTNYNIPLKLPESLEKFNLSALKSWSNYEHRIIIPKNVTEIIGTHSIGSKIKEVILEPNTMISITRIGLGNLSGVSFYVPDNLLNDYKTSISWAVISDQIFGMKDLYSLDQNQLNKLEAIKLDGSGNKFLANDGTYKEIEIDKIMKYKGSKETFNDLPKSNIDIGDFYNVVDTDVNYVWNGSSWDKIGGLLDMGDIDLSTIPLFETEGDGTKFLGDDGVYKEIFADVDLDRIPYMTYASRVYLEAGRPDLFKKAWEDSLEAEETKLEIERDGDISNKYGANQYSKINTNGLIIPYGVTKIGEYSFHQANPLKILVIPDTVTSIKRSAFEASSNNEGMVKLILPKNLTEIGQEAFVNWNSKEALILPEKLKTIGARAFYNWNSHKHPIIIPASVERIGTNAFRYWNATPYILIKGNVVKTLDNKNAFEFTNNEAPIYVAQELLSDYKVAQNWSELSDRIFSIQELNLKELLLTAGDGTKFLSDDGTFKTIELDKIMKYKGSVSIYGDLFYKVDTAEVGDFWNVTESDINYVWNGTSWDKVGGLLDIENLDLSNLSIFETNGDGTKFLGDDGNYKELPLIEETPYMQFASKVYYDSGYSNIFESAWKFRKQVDPTIISTNGNSSNTYGINTYVNGLVEGVVLPEGTTRIGNQSFFGWNNNNKPVVIPNSVTEIGNQAFYNWNDNNCELIIPDSVTSIGSGAFNRWRNNKKELKIPKNVTNIGANAFQYWDSNNTLLNIPEGITVINNDTFGGWSSNTFPIIIPKNIERIGSNAFAGWTKVPYVIIRNDTPPYLVDINAFDVQNNAPIYVPHDKVEDYKNNARWSGLSDRIFSIEVLEPTPGNIGSTNEIMIEPGLSIRIVFIDGKLGYEFVEGN